MASADCSPSTRSNTACPATRIDAPISAAVHAVLQTLGFTTLEPELVGPPEFIQDVLRATLELAKRRLETTELDISEISQRAGFQTIQHFSRVFSQRAGISPKNYRLQSRAHA